MAVQTDGERLNLQVSSSPHIRTGDDTRSIMLDVIIALLPVLALSVYFFGWRSLTLSAVSCGGCVLFEYLYQKLMKKPIRTGDLSAVVTGLLLAYNLPVSAPYWLVLVGDFFAIVIVKQLFGGIGKNFMNPALAARAFLFSWPGIMSSFPAPFTGVPVLGGVDAVSAATPLSLTYLKSGVLPMEGGISLFDLFLGQHGGCLGETSALLILLGGVYLVFRRVITPRIPLVYLGTVALVTFLTPAEGASNLDWMLCQLLSGGLMLGAVFMATDYATSPVTPRGQWIYAVGCGLLTVFIRYFGTYPEGVSYSILVMNACVWLCDKAGRPRRYGETGFFRRGGKAKKEGGKA